MQHYSFNAHLKFEIDKSLIYSIKYASKYEYLLGKVNDVQHIVDRHAGLPVLWKPDLKFNSQKHTLTTYFSSKTIEKYKCNEKKTLAYIPDGIATIKLYLSKEYTWTSGIEKRLLAIVSNIIFTKERTPETQILRNRNRHSLILSKNELYNILLVLNSKLINNLPDEQINKLTSYLWKKYNDGEITPFIEVKRSIRSKQFMNVFLDDNPECQNYTLRKAVIAELNRIKGAPMQKKFASIIKKYRSFYPESTYTDIVAMLVQKHGLTKSNASKKYCQWKKVSLPTALNNKCLYKGVSSDTFLSSDERIAKFITSYHQPPKLTQQVVVSSTGLSIATVKRYWVKNKIKSAYKK